MKTISEHLLPYRAYLAEKQQQLNASIAELEAQSRQDEANLHKIRLNIVQVFETVAAADEKQSGTWADFCARYAPRFETLTAPWRSRLASAVQHSDTHTRFVEEIKLSTADQIRKVFLSLAQEEA